MGNRPRRLASTEQVETARRLLSPKDLELWFVHAIASQFFEYSGDELFDQYKRRIRAAILKRRLSVADPLDHKRLDLWSSFEVCNQEVRNWFLNLDAESVAMRRISPIPLALEPEIAEKLSVYRVALHLAPESVRPAPSPRVRRNSTLSIQTSWTSAAQTITAVTVNNTTVTTPSIPSFRTSLSSP